MATLNLPATTLVTERHPYLLTLRLDEGETADISATARLRRGESTVTPAVSVSAVQDRTVEIRPDAGPLAEGEYDGEITITIGERELRHPISFYRLPATLDTPFPFGIYAVPWTEDYAEWDAVMETLAGAGINVICQHMGGVGEQAPLLDRAARRGIRFMPSDNLHLAGIEPREDLLDRLNIPEPPHARRQLCFNRPEVRVQAAVTLASHLEDYQAHPGFSGLVYYGDDLFLRMHFEHRAAGISCYCDYCREDFRRRTGLEAPEAAEYWLGIVPADYPWRQWNRYRCGEVFGGFIRALEDARVQAAPEVKMGMCHGFPHAPFSYVATGIYGPLTQPTAVVSSYAYPYLRSPRVDLIGHFELGRMGQRGKDVWMLGAFNSNRTLYPAWMVYQNYWNMLAAGYKFIAFFSWWDIAVALKEGHAERVPEEVSALTRCGEHAQWVLPAAKHWHLPSAPFAALYSFTTEAFDLSPQHQGHLHTERALALYRLALQEQVPLEFICEEEVLDGALDRYEAVCLHDVRVLPDTVRDTLEAYVARGGAVFIEQDLLFLDVYHMAVRVRGAVEASPETMVALLRDLAAPPVTVDNPLVTLRRFTSGEVEYLVLVNNATDRYWGMPFRYDDPATNMRDSSLVRDSAEDATLTFVGAGCHLFDLATGDPLGTTDQPLALTLDPSWGRVLAVLPCPEATLAVDGDAVTALGGTAHFTVEMRDGDRRLTGAFTVKVIITSPSGCESGSSGFVSLVDGAAEINWPVGINEEPGMWTLMVEGGFPRRAVERVFTVSEP